MKMKVGYIVTIKSIEWYNKNKDDKGIVRLRGDYSFSGMQKYCGKQYEIFSIKRMRDIDMEIYELRSIYGISGDGSVLDDSFTLDMFEDTCIWPELQEDDSKKGVMK